MANYNKDYMAAYKQYGQSMIAGGGGSNMSGTGSSTMQVFNATRDDNDKPSKGLAAKPTTTTTKEDKPSFWDRITSVFEQNEVDVTNVYKPSVDPAKIYNQPLYTKVPEASDYVYRADMSERTQDMVEQAMGYEKPQLGQLQLLDTSNMTQEEKDRFAPLIKLADDIRNENITTTELPPIEEDLSSRITNIRDVRYDSALEGKTSEEEISAAIGAALDAVDPETGQKILSAEDVAERNKPESQGLMSRPSFTESQPEDSMLGGVFNIIPDAFQVSNWLTGGNQLDGKQGEKPSSEPELGPEQGPVLYPSNERSVITYARDVYPDNPKAAAALAATIQFEGMENPEEDVSSYNWNNITSSNSPAGWLKGSITSSNKPWAKKRTSKLYQLYGGKPKTDADGNTIPLTREPTKEEIKAVQTKLKERGFYKGAIDGIFGKGSKAALKEFQGIENSNLETLSSDYPKMPENGELDRYTAMFFDIELRLKDHKGSPMIEYEKPTNPVVPAGEKVVDITYNPYYRANGYSDQLGDVSKEGLEGNTPGAGTFRGRGPIQITNKTMYEKLRQKVRSETGVDIMRNPSAVANDLNVSKAATVAFLNEVGFDKLSPKQALKVINPQMPNSKLNERLKAYNKYLKAMKE